MPESKHLIRHFGSSTSLSGLCEQWILCEGSPHASGCCQRRLCRRPQHGKRCTLLGEFDTTFSAFLASARSPPFISVVERAGINATVPYVVQPPVLSFGFRLGFTYNIWQYIMRSLEFRAVQVDTEVTINRGPYTKAVCYGTLQSRMEKVTMLESPPQLLAFSKLLLARMLAFGNLLSGTCLMVLNCRPQT